MSAKVKRARAKARKRGPGRRLLGSRRRHAPGVSPGTIRAGRDDASFSIDVLAYSATKLQEESFESAHQLVSFESDAPVVWVDVHGLENTKALQELAAHYGLHPLLIEDIVNTGQRPKFEVYGDCQFCVLRMVDPTRPGQFEQVSLVRRGNLLISFQERSGDCFDPVRSRIRGATGRIRTRDTSYLFYAIVDSVIDHYFPVVEALADHLVETEQAIVANPDAMDISQFYAFRAECAAIQRIARPMRDTVSALSIEAARLGDEDLAPYLRDVSDHTVELLDMVEACREAASGLMDLYMSVQGQRMNEIMKVLTMIATIFIPLSFVAGLYGMNFDGMPELHWRYGYPVALGIMLLAALVMVRYFRRKGWLGTPAPTREDTTSGASELAGSPTEP